MAKFTWDNGTIVYGGLEIGGDYANNFECDVTSQEEGSQTFGSGGWEELASTLKQAAVQVQGFYPTTGAGAVYDEMFSEDGQFPFIACEPRPAAEGNDCFVGRVVRTGYTQTNQVAQLQGFQLNMRGAPFMAFGKISANATGITATGNTTGTQHLANTGKTILFAAGLLRNGGVGTLDLTLQSDDNSGFTSAATKVTLAQLSTTGDFAFGFVSGSDADDWYRTAYTVAGGSPDLDFVTAFAVI